MFLLKFSTCQEVHKHIWFLFTLLLLLGLQMDLRVWNNEIFQVKIEELMPSVSSLTQHRNYFPLCSSHCVSFTVCDIREKLSESHFVWVVGFIVLFLFLVVDDDVSNVWKKKQVLIKTVPVPPTIAFQYEPHQKICLYFYFQRLFL